MGDPLHNISNDTASIEDWTKEEKFYLLQALKAFSSQDIDRIHQYISTKTPDQIIMAINHYKQIASKHPVLEQAAKKQTTKLCKPRIPLSRWAKLLTDHFSLDELKTETSTAVRMIAELENIPHPVYTENIDFRNIYRTIANAMEGKALAQDKNAIALLNKCIIETALLSKGFLGTNSYNHILHAAEINTEEVHTFPKPTDNQELSILRHLASQKSYNPFRVSEEYMKPTCFK